MALARQLQYTPPQSAMGLHHVRPPAPGLQHDQVVGVCRHEADGIGGGTPETEDSRAATREWRRRSNLFSVSSYRCMEVQ